MASSWSSGDGFPVASSGINEPVRTGIPSCQGVIGEVLGGGREAPGWLWAGHAFRDHPLVELLPGQKPGFDGGFAQGQTFFVTEFGDGGGFVITDVLIEGRYQHQ